jgi:hypothetical protein
VLVAALAATAAGGSAAAAVAPPAPSIAVDPSGGHPLDSVTVSGSSFCATCGPVQIRVDFQPVGSATPSGDGTFSALVQIPGTVRPEQIPIDATQTATSGTPTTARTWFTVTVSETDEGDDGGGGVNISRHEPSHRSTPGRPARTPDQPAVLQRPVPAHQPGPIDQSATALHVQPAANSRPIDNPAQLAGLLAIPTTAILLVARAFLRRRRSGSADTRIGPDRGAPIN